MRNDIAHSRCGRRAALLVLAALAPAAAQAETRRGPDAHVLGPPRGDVLTDRRARPRTTAKAADVYVAPYPGWTYARPRTGQRLRPGFWGPAYILASPDLPRARGDQRWIRYGDDRVLVNVRTGRVVRVVANVFGTPAARFLSGEAVQPG